MFQSLAFWQFVVVASMFFWLFPARVRPWVLFAFSFLLMALLSVGYLTSFLGAALLSAIVFFVAPLTTGNEHWRTRLLGSVVICLVGLLLWFKYLPPLIVAFQSTFELPSFVVPIGISYYTLKLIHYAIEVSRETLPKHSLSDFLLYMLLLPTFSAGPIERFDHFCQNRSQTWRHDFLLEGATRVCHGLVKKFAITEVLLMPLHGELRTIGDLIGALDQIPFYRVWWFLVLSYLTAYLDFSAYSDIAIGTSRFFGIRIMENFNFPVLASNLTEFWKRWHMTLAGWCQRYVYMPMIGLTRNPYFAVYTSFLTMGLWHDAAPQWFAWGLYHATGIVVHQNWSRWRRKRRLPLPPIVASCFGWCVTFMFVSAGYAFVTGYPDAPISDSFRLLLKAFAVI
jgi:alginate O-acetyltransferase complex protein AlgI